MPVTSLSFLAAVAALLAVYFRISSTARQHALLLAASYAFCATWGARACAGIAILTLVVAGLGRIIVRSPRWASVALSVGVAANLVALFAFRDVLGRFSIASLGLSFVALQGISYLVDVRTGSLAGGGTLPEVALYLAYFPKVLAGPVERPRTFFGELRGPRIVDADDLAAGVTLVLVGLVRKLVLADPLFEMLPADVFTAPPGRGPSATAWALAVFVFALYNDFAGYSSIAVGVSRLFGIELTRNFVQPFFSRSFTDGWNRWHASLSRWLREYVYLPLSRALIRRSARTGSIPAIVLPPMATMLASGLWHGGGSGLLAWGAVHGSYLVVERAGLQLRRPRPGAEPRLAARLLGPAAVFLLGGLTMPLFRTSLPAAVDMWRALFVAHGWTVPSARPLLLIVPSLMLDAWQARGGDEGAFLRLPRAARVAAAAAGVLLVLLFGRDVGRPFVYQGF